MVAAFNVKASKMSKVSMQKVGFIRGRARGKKLMGLLPDLTGRKYKIGDEEFRVIGKSE